jgi:diacylglycerol kinase family enzyme
MTEARMTSDHDRDTDARLSAAAAAAAPVAAAPPPVAPASRAQHWLARLALLLAAASVVVLLAVAGFRSIALVIVGTAGTVVVLAAAWWFLTHRGVLRWAAATLLALAPLTVAVLYARAGLIWVVALCAALAAGALTAARGALAVDAAGPEELETPPPRHPVLIMNPRSGGGKVERFDLVRRARELGAEVIVLDGPGTVDVAALARQALADGADLIGVAGGDGTQALVAGIAAEHDVPFMVISAGTRNHFALDLGLDREDPSTCLDALSDGVELRIDLGLIGGRTFVNNASFGAYATVVQSPAYRDDKTRTTLDLLPELLAGHRGPRLRVSVGDVELEGPQAVLVSNNPYDAGDVAGLGRRGRLDGGVLGVLSVSVAGVADAAGLVMGRRSKAVWVTTADEVVVDADLPSIPVGIDGESVAVATPVHCAVRPRALRVRVPRQRPGSRAARPQVDWTRLRHLAFSVRHGDRPEGSRHASRR